MNSKPPRTQAPAGSAPRRERPSFPVKLHASSAPGSTMGTAAPVQKQAVSSAVPVMVFGHPQRSEDRFAHHTSAFGSGLGMDSQAVRAAMVSKLQKQGVSHPSVLTAMQLVERHRFVDSALATQAYEDTSLPIGLGQTISKPNVVARMLELLVQGRPGKLGRVLEIGTGCGYQAAVLSHLSNEVYSIERLRALHEKARENLRWFRLSNVHLLFGDGMLGYPKGAPYAGIIAAAGGDEIPGAWTEQLAMGGRLVAPALGPSGQQQLVVVEKTSRGLIRSALETVVFVPLKSGVA